MTRIFTEKQKKRRKEYIIEWRKNNQDRIKEYRKEYNKLNKDKLKEYRKKNKKFIVELNKRLSSQTMYNTKENGK